MWYSYRELGHLKQAIDTAEESIAIANEMNFLGPQWGALVELGATFDWLGDYARATEYAQRALANIMPNTPTHPFFPTAVLAMVALHQGHHAKAKEFLESFSIDSFELLFQINPIGAVHGFATLIEIALADGNANQALALVDQALVMMQKRGFVIAFPIIGHLQAKAFRMLNRTDEAYTLLLDARQQAESMQLRYRLLPILFTLIEMETERSDADAANKARTQARGVIDYIVAHMPQEFRASFLNLPNVRAAID